LRGIAIRRAGKLDESVVSSELEPLLVLEEDIPSAERLHRILVEART
jgi:hypothetical protein